ncbi:MAG TPA: hypothetical protein VFX98_12805 [Longimicrobiaceae bacterium]|nr:hypothetical protein [Longimicrobiaceae bacterium]
MHHLVRRFPGLASSSFTVTSSRTRDYNCFAWAVYRTDVWISPVLYDPIQDLYTWPAGAAREDTLEAWSAALAAFGFEPCATADLEPRFEKVAVYASAETPTHMARQLATGRWTSKLGKLEDVEHDLHALAGSGYGEVALILRRPSPR